MIKRRGGVSPVIAVILMLAITVVLAAVAWLMVSGMISKLEVPPTYIDLVKDEEQFRSYERNVLVGGVEKAYYLEEFEVLLIINDTDTASALDPLSNTTVGNLTFADGNGDGKLNQGDYFVVTVAPRTYYELKLFWIKNGSQLTTESWYEP